MHKLRARHGRALAAVTIAAVATACGGGGSTPPPTAIAQSGAVAEDGALNGQLTGQAAKGKPLTFSIATAPSNGTVELDSASGRFTYRPAPDFNGSDSFHFRVQEGRRSSLPATVTVAVSPVNDPPTLGEIARQSNSGYSYETLVPLESADVDGDRLDIEVVSSDSRVATAEYQPEGRRLVIKPFDRGVAAIKVRASDGELTAEREFEFEVGDATKSVDIVIDDPREIVVIRNLLDRPVEFRLVHNDFTQMESTQDVIRYVSAMKEDSEDETFPHKLWRFLRDRIYHGPSFGARPGAYDPMVTINSLGWGMCDNLASNFVSLAREAGYQARVWGLTGHVVPEVLLDGRWQVFDADLGVYYKTQEGRVAGVAELSNDPSLVISPVDPVADPERYRYLYAAELADYYGSQHDNVQTEWFNPPVAPRSGRLVLPVGAVLRYPGHWSAQPEGTDGSVGQMVGHWLEAMVVLPAGWTGDLELPWVLREVRGAGQIEIAGQTWEAGSTELTGYLAANGVSVGRLSVANSGSELRLIFFVNAVGYQLRSTNQVRLTGQHVWALQTEVGPVSEAAAVKTTLLPGMVKPGSSAAEG